MQRLKHLYKTAKWQNVTEIPSIFVLMETQCADYGNWLEEEGRRVGWGMEVVCENDGYS